VTGKSATRPILEELNSTASREDYVLTADIVLTVAVENGRLFMRENDEEKQE